MKNFPLLKSLLPVLAGLAIGSSAAYAQTSEGTASRVPSRLAPGVTQTAPAAKGAPDQVICRRDTETGSRLRQTKICKTRAEWNAMRDTANRIVDDIEKQSLPPPLPPGGG
jgi:hypothetical protein